MKASCTLLLLSILRLCVATPASAADYDLPAGGKLVAGETYFQLKIAELSDLNNVALTDGKQKVWISMASVLPFGDWPRDDQSQQMKAEFLQQLRAGLVGKQVLYEVREVDEDGLSHGDLVIGPGGGFGQENWSGKNLAESYGWGMTNVNLLLIERGYSPYVKRVYDNSRKEYVSDLFDKAEQVALWKRAGFRLNDVSARSLEETAGERSNECRLILRGLEWPQVFTIAKQLLVIPDAKIRMAMVRTMYRVPSQPSQRVEWCELLLARYFEEPEPAIRLQMLLSIELMGLPAEQGQPFVEKVLKIETDEDIRREATFWQKSLK